MIIYYTNRQMYDIIMLKQATPNLPLLHLFSILFFMFVYSNAFIYIDGFFLYIIIEVDQL